MVFMVFDNSTDNTALCNETVTKLFNDQTNNSLVNATSIYNLYYFCAKGKETKLNDDEFSKPLVAIGVYIALASLCCVFAMGADFVHGMRKDRYEFRSKYFSLNVVSLTLITAAMKLPVDLSGSMPGNLDQTAKIGSIAFLCTSLAIFNPSLASMNNKELSVNIGGLVLFVVTVAANVFIEIGTGVIKDVGPFHVFTSKRDNKWKWRVGDIYYSTSYVRLAASYAGIMVLLLAISISTAIIIPSFKKILDDKYQIKRQALNDEITIKQRRHGNNRITTVEEITQYVTRFLIMTKTGSPEFVMARNMLSYGSFFFCAYGMVIFPIVFRSFFKNFTKATNEYESDYEWSIPFILAVQIFGYVLGTVFVGFRCYGCMKFRDFSMDYKWNRTKVKYWTDKLREWKKACTNRYPIAAASSNYPASRLLVNKCVYFMINCGLSICIGLQSTFVLVIQNFMVITVLGLRALRPRCRVPTTPAVPTSQIEDLSGYVLQLDDEMKASPEVVEKISRFMKLRIESARDKENNKVFNNNLLELLAAKRPDDDGFKGVEIFDDDDDQIKLSSSWSVPVITLASIAISSVPGIAKDQVQSLIQAIDEALLCIHPVEESFDRANEFVYIRKAATTLWVDAKATTTGAHTIDFPNDDQSSSSSSSAAGLLMRRIKRSISTKYPEEIQTNERFFRLLRSMIADVLVACFSNLPRVVMMKCHANEIEKREASVEAAVKLLVKSTKIIEKLEECQLPAGLDPDKMASIEEWIIHLKQLSHPWNSIITFNT